MFPLRKRRRGWASHPNAVGHVAPLAKGKHLGLVQVFDRIEIARHRALSHGGRGLVLCREQHLPRVLRQSAEHQAAQGEGEAIGADRRANPCEAGVQCGL